MTASTVHGRLYDNRYCWIFETAAPRVRRIHEYMDTFNGHRMIFGEEAPGSLVD